MPTEKFSWDDGAPYPHMDVHSGCCEQFDTTLKSAHGNTILVRRCTKDGSLAFTDDISGIGISFAKKDAENVIAAIREAVSDV